MNKPEVKSVRDADVSGKRVLLRVDFNVPLKDGVVVDDTRIKAALPTINFLLERGVKIVIITSLGRPEGKVVESLRVAPVAKRLSELVTAEVEIMENLRFNPGEEANDPVFAEQLAKGCDLFVNDAFADSHRAHASIVGIPKFLPSFAGLLMEREIENLSGALVPPPGAIAIIGGAKLETKEALIEKLLLAYDKVLVGGALANDFLKARGVDVGMSLVSGTAVPNELATDARVLSPTDTVVVSGRNVDIGEGTAHAWGELITKAPFVLWNGPMGIYEEGQTAGTNALAQALASSPARGVVGGGDTIAAIAQYKFDPNNIFISTGGGAMLDFLAKGTLPGIEALKV
jgi:phosphoglycerate kinase